MMNRVCIVFAVWLMLAGNLGAANIFVGNNSFEPVPTTTGALTGFLGSSAPLGAHLCVGGPVGCYTDNGIVDAGGPAMYAMAGLTDWTVKFSGGAPLTTADRFGLWAPTLAIPSLGLAAATHGGNVAYATIGATTGTIDITQALSTTFSLATTYVMTVDVGWRTDQALTPGYTLILGSTTDGGATYTTLATDTSALTQGVWSNRSFAYNSTAADVGKNIFLILSATGIEGSMVNFDNVLLTADAAIPEPGTLGLLGGAVLALGCLARRR